MSPTAVAVWRRLSVAAAKAVAMMLLRGMPEPQSLPGPPPVPRSGDASADLALVVVSTAPSGGSISSC